MANQLGYSLPGSYQLAITGATLEYATARAACVLLDCSSAHLEKVTFLTVDCDKALVRARYLDRTATRPPKTTVFGTAMEFHRLLYARNTVYYVILD